MRQSFEALALVFELGLDLGRAGAEQRDSVVMRATLHCASRVFARSSIELRKTRGTECGRRPRLRCLTCTSFQCSGLQSVLVVVLRYKLNAQKVGT